MATEAKVDPMHQFTIEPLAGTAGWEIAGYNVAFTNSALWMLITTVVLTLFVAGGLRRQMVPGRWQMMVETLTASSTNAGSQYRQGGAQICALCLQPFMFILFANILGLLPLGVVGVHPFTFTSHFTVTGILAVLSFGIVLVVGFWRHGLHFFSLFVPHGTPLPMIPIIAPIEFISFMVRPFSLGLRLFVAMMAGHVLLEVLSSFVIDGTNAGVGFGLLVGLPSFILMVGICALELLVDGIQAYVFALLTSLYINDAENPH